MFNSIYMNWWAGSARLKLPESRASGTARRAYPPDMRQHQDRLTRLSDQTLGSPMGDKLRTVSPSSTPLTGEVSRRSQGILGLPSRHLRHRASKNRKGLTSMSPIPRPLAEYGGRTMPSRRVVGRISLLPHAVYDSSRWISRAPENIPSGCGSSRTEDVARPALHVVMSWRLVSTPTFRGTVFLRTGELIDTTFHRPTGW